MKNNNLKKAEKYYKHGYYSKVIRLLEPDVFNFRENDRYYYILGSSCLLSGDYSGANSYIRRSLQINSVNSDTLLALAVIHLKRNNSKEAIRIWLDILDKQPDNRYAKKGLNLLKKSGVPESISEQFIKKNVYALIPGRGLILFHRLLRFLLFTVIIGIAAGGIYFGSLKTISYIQNKNNILPEVTLDKNMGIVLSEGNFELELSEKDIIKTFNRARKNFIDNRDNESQIEINRILNSNASENVKDKVKILQSYLKKPDFRYFRNTISYREVIEKPLIFNNCYVKWKGKITNIQVHKNNLEFDFLVGYEDGKLLEGIIRVDVDFPILLEEDFSYEIIGQMNTSDSFKLKAVSIRKFL
jgi:tetratricopeptide (TPR) repeat protein